MRTNSNNVSNRFQSTPPARGATQTAKDTDSTADISIHAPREGGDTSLTNFFTPCYNISIHAPREGGDVNSRYDDGRTPRISIHAPREGGDVGLVSFFIPMN